VPKAAASGALFQFDGGATLDSVPLPLLIGGQAMAKPLDEQTDEELETALARLEAGPKGDAPAQKGN
jgi:hypothetical protein